jgi:hypothetical protein
MDIVHKSGKKHTNVDALSRLVSLKEIQEYVRDVTEQEDGDEQYIGSLFDYESDLCISSTDVSTTKTR